MNAVESIDRHLIALFNVDDGRAMEVDTYGPRERGVPDRFIVVSELGVDDRACLVRHHIGRQRWQAVLCGRRPGSDQIETSSSARKLASTYCPVFSSASVYITGACAAFFPA